jgi:hypothetical protein
LPDGYYPIEQVEPEWVLEPEHLGGKEKFWYLKPGEDELEWLFKYPRPNSGEHWAEKIAAEVAMLLKIPCARVELAVFQGDRGSASESFLDQHQELFLGNQILEHHLEDYDQSLRRFEQSQHTLENIWRSFERVFKDPEGIVAAKARFADFLVLDAVIGNTDRHNENWGVARRYDEGKWVGYLARSFDHASSLGRELSDEKREQRLNNGQINNYSKRGRGGVFWSESDRYGPCPLDLVRLAFDRYRAFLESALARLSELEDEKVAEIVERVPSDWMSGPARRFAIQLISYNCQELRELM